jgi:MOB kinase activator 1
LLTRYPCSVGKSKSGTVKKKHIKEGDKFYQLGQYADASLGSGDLKKAVKCPEGEDINEWLAYNGITYFYFYFTYFK